MLCMPGTATCQRRSFSQGFCLQGDMYTQMLAHGLLHEAMTSTTLTGECGLSQKMMALIQLCWLMCQYRLCEAPWAASRSRGYCYDA